MRLLHVSSRRHQGLVLSTRARAGFTLPELLVVGGIIALLIAIVLPALSGGKRTAEMAKSKARLKEIATWMTAYSSENREYIVPSQFDYTAAAAISAVKVRSYGAPAVGAQYQGTWTDILWQYAGLKVVGQTVNNEYQFDSPDKAYYGANSDDDGNPFRAARANTRNTLNGDGIATPFGTGALEAGDPGYFAANNFFNTTGVNGRWFVTGQIKAPDRSLYIVDSIAGETIEPDGTPPNSPWYNPVDTAVEGGGGGPVIGQPNPIQVDFRYNGSCLMLFLDGHSESQAPWFDLDRLEASAHIKVRNLDQN